MKMVEEIVKLVCNHFLGLFFSACYKQHKQNKNQKLNQVFAPLHLCLMNTNADQEIIIYVSCSLVHLKHQIYFWGNVLLQIRHQNGTILSGNVLPTLYIYLNIYLNFKSHLS